ncbi:hypothetical protein FA13DRAFT_1720695 [Coprinellus micaceus]|uniref:Uncharacterized protein n=1 Tax=Coprinellus micaceus TaxID=71717 RepID=A0A4Y7S6V3_COPMI|nr:hypothetical protein FA13DRAFT_1720695 [Coprinellus micaceus]
MFDQLLSGIWLCGVQADLENPLRYPERNGLRCSSILPKVSIDRPRVRTPAPSHSKIRVCFAEARTHAVRVEMGRMRLTKSTPGRSNPSGDTIYKELRFELISDTEGFALCTLLAYRRKTLHSDQPSAPYILDKCEPQAYLGSRYMIWEEARSIQQEWKASGTLNVSLVESATHHSKLQIGGRERQRLLACIRVLNGQYPPSEDPKSIRSEGTQVSQNAKDIIVRDVPEGGSTGAVT